MNDVFNSNKFELEYFEDFTIKQCGFINSNVTRLLAYKALKELTHDDNWVLVENLQNRLISDSDSDTTCIDYGYGFIPCNYIETIENPLSNYKEYAGFKRYNKIANLPKDKIYSSLCNVFHVFSNLKMIYKHNKKAVSLDVKLYIYLSVFGSISIFVHKNDIEKLNNFFIGVKKYS